MIPQTLKLSIRDRFTSWTIAKNHIKEFEKQRGFVINRYQIEYYKTQLSDLTEWNIKKRTYVCEYFKKYKLNKTQSIEIQCNRGSKKTGCKWHVNLSNPKNSDTVHE